MKHLAGAIGLVALAAGAVQAMSSSPPQSGAPPAAETGQFIDTALFWREASGPHGERDPAALPLYDAVFAHDKARVASLLDRGASPNALLYPGGWSPLMVAIAYNDSAIAEVLVKHGADINYIANDPATGTPLAVALSYGRFYPLGNPTFALLRHLLDSGADVNAEFHGKDIATFAVSVGQIEMLNEFLARGYRHNLPKLQRLLEIVHVDEKTQPEKDKALHTIKRLLAS